MVAPTFNNIKTWSLVDFAALSVAVSDAKLAVFVARANDYVVTMSGRSFEQMPASFETLAQECVQMRTEQLCYQAQPDQIDTRTDDLVSSFGTDGYNESRRGLNEPDKEKMVNSWQALHDRLWRLMTDESRDEWRERWAGAVPAFEVSEVDWNYFGNSGLGSVGPQDDYNMPFGV